MKKILTIILSLAFVNCQNSGHKKVSRFKDVDVAHITGNVEDFTCTQNGTIRINVMPEQDREIAQSSYLGGVDSIEIIPLSNERNAVIGTVNKIKVTDDCIYVLDMHKTKSLRCFTREGTFFAQLWKCGRRPF